MSGVQKDGRMEALASQVRERRGEGFQGGRKAFVVKSLAGLGVGLVLAAVGSGRAATWFALAHATPEKLASPGGDGVSAVVRPVSEGPRSSSSALTATVSTAAGAAVASRSEAQRGRDDATDAAPDPPQGLASDGKVILNVADEAALTRLPGIGVSRARAILALRTRLKRFARIEDLLRVKGLGRKRLARLKPLVVLDPAPTP